MYGNQRYHTLSIFFLTKYKEKNTFLFIQGNKNRSRVIRHEDEHFLSVSLICVEIECIIWVISMNITEQENGNQYYVIDPDHNNYKQISVTSTLDLQSSFSVIIVEDTNCSQNFFSRQMDINIIQVLIIYL